MRMEPQFDPVFERGEQRAGDRSRTERAAFAFDGWSLSPIASPIAPAQETSPVAAGRPLAR